MSNQTAATNRNWTRVLCLVTLLAGMAVGAYFSSDLQFQVRKGITSLRGSSGWGPAVVGLMFIPACVLALPTFWLATFGGFAFGVTTTVLAVWIGSTIGATVAFFIGRYLGRDWIAQRVARYPRISALDQAFEQPGWKLVLILRFSPIVPFNFLNYACGLTSMTWKSYVMATAAGTVPGIFAFTLGGVLLSDSEFVGDYGRLKMPMLQYLGVAGLFLAVIAVVWMKRFVQQTLRQASGSGESQPGIPEELN